MLDFIVVELTCCSEVGSLMWTLRWARSDVHTQTWGGWGRGYVSLQENSVGLQLRDWLLLFDLGILSTVQTFQDILFDWKLSVHQFICKKPIFRLLNCICCCWNSPKIIFNFEKLRSSPPMRSVAEFQVAAHTAHRSLQWVILLKQKPGLLSALYFPVA